MEEMQVFDGLVEARSSLLRTHPNLLEEAIMESIEKQLNAEFAAGKQPSDFWVTHPPLADRFRKMQERFARQKRERDEEAKKVEEYRKNFRMKIKAVLDKQSETALMVAPYRKGRRSSSKRKSVEAPPRRKAVEPAPKQGPSETVPQQGPSGTVPEQGSSGTAPQQGPSGTAPKQGRAEEAAPKKGRPKTASKREPAKKATKAKAKPEPKPAPNHHYNTRSRSGK